MLQRFVAGRVWAPALSFIAMIMMIISAGAATDGSTGLAVVIANSYDEFLPASLRGADAIADKLEESGFTTIRLREATGGEMAASMVQVRQAAETAGPLRLVYMSGFGMCVSDDIVLFAEDMQPEQFKSGQIGDVVVPVSLVAEAVSGGADRILVVFDINPRQCTQDMVNAVKLPENAGLLITTGIGGDVIDEIDEGGMSAFATAFVETFTTERPIKDIVTDVVTQVREMTEEQQTPILVGGL
jgi:hypothetical protein